MQIPILNGIYADATPDFRTSLSEKLGASAKANWHFGGVSSPR